MSRKVVIVGLLFIFACAATAAAQSFELAGLGGGQFPQGKFSTTTFQRSAAVQANFAFRIAHVPLIAAYAEVPVVFGTNASIISAVTTLPRNYSSLYVTPGLRVKFAPISPISPFLAGGVGFARMKSSSTLANGAPNPTTATNNSIFDIGGGIDMKVAPFLSFRAEVRDFYAGLPNGNGVTGRQHTLIPSGGLVLRF